VRNALNEIRRLAGQPLLCDLNDSDRLQDDLNLDSLQLAELSILLEAKYGVDVFADGIVRTVGEVAEKIERKR